MLLSVQTLRKVVRDPGFSQFPECTGMLSVVGSSALCALCFSPSARRQCHRVLGTISSSQQTRGLAAVASIIGDKQPQEAVRTPGMVSPRPFTAAAKEMVTARIPYQTPIEPYAPREHL